jgi:hypothetical protein
MPTGSYRDGDLVYVDPESRTVVGPVQWSRNGNPKSMPYKPVVEEAKAKDPKGKDREERRRSTRKNYPWGTYKSMKNVYKLEGKKRTDPNKKFEEVIDKALAQPFWD